MKKNEQISMDIDDLISGGKAALHLQNYNSRELHFFELQTPFLMILSTSSQKRNDYVFCQFSFDGCYCHVLKEEEFLKYQNRPQHQHSFIEIIYVLSGEVTNYIEDKTFTYHPGDCVIMNRNIHHKEEGDYQAVYFDFQEEFINQLISEETAAYKNISGDYQAFLQSDIVKMLQEAHTSNSRFQKIYFDCFPVISSASVLDQMHSLLDQMVRELSSGDPGAFYITKGCLQKFLSILCDPSSYNVLSTSSTLAKKDFVLAKIRQILESRLGRISRSELSAMLHYNEEYLNRIIKQSTGKTFSQYRQDIVLREAKRLLVETDLSISAIMDQLELSNRSFFYRTFQKEFGQTPSEFRHQNRPSG